MSGQDASPNEMPRFVRQAGLRRESEELALDKLLDGWSLPPEVPPELSALPRMLAELSGPASPSELAGEKAALSRFRRHLPPAGISPARPPERSGPVRRGAVLRGRLAAAVAAAGVVLGGTAAAYAGVLPSSVQELAHHVIDAPPAVPASPVHPARSSGHRPEATHRGWARGGVRGRPVTTPASGTLGRPGPGHGPTGPRGHVKPPSPGHVKPPPAPVKPPPAPVKPPPVPVKPPLGQAQKPPVHAPKPPVHAPGSRGQAKKPLGK